MGPDVAKRIRELLQGTLDWQYVIDAAAAHGVKPLLCHNVTDTYRDCVPKDVLEQLQRYLRAHSLNNLFLTRELIKVLGGLGQIGVSAIPWKGPVLAAAAYGDTALRQFGDLDILVREQDAMRSKDLLLSSGYRLLYQKTTEDEAAFHKMRQVYELVRQDGRVLLELHWAITSQTFYFPLDPASLWDDVETVPVHGASIPNFGPEDLLMVLCVHGAKHHWGKLMWICDIAELLRVCSKRIDWIRLRNRANALGGWRMLCLGVLLAHDLLGTDVPDDVLHAVQAEPKAGLLAAQVRSRLFAGLSVMAVDRPTFYIQLRERPQDRWRCRIYLGYRKLAPQTQARTLRLFHSGRSFLQRLQRQRRRSVNRDSTNRL